MKSAGRYRFSFRFGIVAPDDQHAARVEHIAGGLTLPDDEWLALDGAPAEYIGACRFRVGSVVVTVQGGCDHRPRRRTGPYGVEISWAPIAGAA